MPYNRRDFLHLTAGAAAGALLPAAGPAGPWRRSDPVIDRITVLTVPGEFYRWIGMNAYDTAPKGRTGTADVVRVVLSDGTVGVGVTGYSRVNEARAAGLQRLIGVHPLDVYAWEDDRIAGFAPAFKAFFEDLDYAWFEGPLLDAVGKLKGLPVHRLYGPAVRTAADAYDGTLYFEEVARNAGVGLIGELAARIQADGYRAIKMKVGRPFKWLPGEAGVERDIEAVAAAREAVGANFNLMLDANDGYRGDTDQAVRFLKAVHPYEIYWIEELFPEDTERYRQLRRAMFEGGFWIPVADGENINRVDDYAPFLMAGIFEFIQPDIRTAGFTNIVRAARSAAEHGVKLVPHNWRSEMGRVMGVHACLISRNIPFVEDDRFRNFGIDTSAYLFRDGRWWAPDLPGWGVSLSDHYDYFARASTEQVIGRS